ncbi:gluconokinase [Paragemmobacter aquarius]|nr:gluconokinase [Gemmobacter aquarius]
MKIVLMGVAGCGKSSVGAALSALLAMPYIDGDDLHPAANVAKMAAGTPLTDDDRWPWLDACTETLATGNIILGCSALKRVYRDRLRRAGGVRFVHLSGTRDLIAARMAQRSGHYMPLSLLDSQFAALEPPAPDENALTISIGPTPKSIATAIAAQLTGTTP